MRGNSYQVRLVRLREQSPADNEGLPDVQVLGLR